MAAQSFPVPRISKTSPSERAPAPSSSSSSSASGPRLEELPEILRVYAQRGYVDDLRTALQADPKYLNATDDLGNTLLRKEI